MMTAKHIPIIIFILLLTPVLIVACTSPEPVDEEPIIATPEPTPDPAQDPTPTSDDRSGDDNNQSSSEDSLDVAVSHSTIGNTLNNTFLRNDCIV